MKKTSLFILVLLLLSLAVSADDGPKAMEIKDLFSFKGVRGPKLSPDGQYVLYTVSETNWKTNGFTSHIWRVKTDGTDARQLTRGEKSCGSPVWCPSGKTFAFTTSRSGKSQIWLMKNDGGEAWQLSDHENSVYGLTWSKDGKTIYFLARDPETEADKTKKEKKNSVRVVDQNLKNSHLYAFDVASKKATKITNGDFNVNSYKLSPDESKAALIVGPTSKEDDNLKIEVYLLDIAEKKVKRLTTNGITESDVQWHPSGKKLTLISDSSSDLKTYYLRSIFELELKEGARLVDLLPDSYNREVSNHRWVKVDGKDMILANINTGVNSHYFLFDYEKKEFVKQISQNDGVYSSADFRDNKLVYSYTDPYTPSDIYYSESWFKEEKRLTDTNPQIKDFKLAKYETIQWKASDGQIVEGILILPPDYEKGKKYPMLAQLHGGPESSYKKYFSTSYATYPHVLAGMGYVLFQPNYRGSTGYGDDCMRAIIGRYFEQDIDDILTGIDYLIEKGIADKDKLGAMGWSAGGHLSNWLLVKHSDRFKAIGTGAGVANWASFYAQTDMHYIREIWQTGTPYDKADLYKAKSPITFIKGAKTPTIMFVGERDNRVPAPQSWELYIGLRKMGVPVEFHLYPGEPHGLRKLAHRVDKMEAEVAWFNKYILGKEVKKEQIKKEEKKEEAKK